MRHTQALQDQLYDEFSGRVGGDDRSPYLQVDNWYYYSRYGRLIASDISCRDINMVVDPTLKKSTACIVANTITPITPWNKWF